MSRITKAAGIVLLIFALFNTATNAQGNRQIHYITDNVSHFDSLINRFKGRSIYIDMWATWCHPCAKELQDKKKIKGFAAFAENDNVAIIYLSFDKDVKSWKRFVQANQLFGYHVLVSDSLSKELHQRFSYEQTGHVHLKYGFYLPRHMIINRNGKIVDSLAGAQSTKYAYDTITELLHEPN